MLCKSVCGRCSLRLRHGDGWKSITEDAWYYHLLICPAAKHSWIRVRDKAPEVCPHRMEHAVAEAMTNAK